jgi:tRNA G18 (ribose-2'-O)-methylase SpoU
VIHRAHAGDPGLDSYRYVGDPGWLTQRRLFVAEGRLVVERLLASKDYEIESIVVTPAAFDALSEGLADVPCDVYICDQPALETVTGFNFHRGCLALARRRHASEPAVLFGARRLLALEGVGNPDNIGGLFRTAAAFGAGGILLDPASGDPLYRKAIRTSMAATLQLQWVRIDSWPQGMAAFREEGFTLVALTPDRTARTIEEFAVDVTDASRLMFLFGTEGSGLSQDALQLADVRVRIPIDPSVDSLNVVVAAGIVLDRLR